MSTITKERAQEIFLGNGPEPTASEERELALIALASLEAEAVALRDERSGSGGISKKPGFNDLPHGTPLYAAPPMPISVPTFEEWCERTEQKPVGWVRDAMKEAYDGCRDARLQGADQATVKQPSSNSVLGWLRADYQDDNRGLRGNAPLFVLGKKDPSTVWGLDYIPLTSNSPVIPDGWVACSERMPETAGNYWGWWSESKRQGPVWFIKSELQAQFQSSEITHWMPLPAAPQQEA